MWDTFLPFSMPVYPGAPKHEWRYVTGDERREEPPGDARSDRIHHRARAWKRRPVSARSVAARAVLLLLRRCERADIRRPRLRSGRLASGSAASGRRSQRTTSLAWTSGSRLHSDGCWYPHVVSTPDISTSSSSGATAIFGSVLRFAVSGASRDRTGDLRLAKAALCQLSYGPFAPKSRARLAIWRRHACSGPPQGRRIGRRCLSTRRPRPRCRSRQGRRGRGRASRRQ